MADVHVVFTRPDFSILGVFESETDAREAVAELWAIQGSAAAPATIASIGITPRKQRQFFLARCNVCEMEMPFGSDEQRTEWVKVHEISTHWGHEDEEITITTREEVR